MCKRIGMHRATGRDVRTAEIAVGLE